MSQIGYTTLQSYHSVTPGAVPLASNVIDGELAVNTADRKLYTRNAAGTVVQIGGGASGGGTDMVFYENSIIVASDYTITTGKNAMSTGPITINSGVTITVPPGSVWSII